MNREVLLEQVKRAICEMEPEAEIILYGSRAREDSRAQSDWDFLVLVDGLVNDERTEKFDIAFTKLNGRAMKFSAALYAAEKNGIVLSGRVCRFIKMSSLRG